MAKVSLETAACWVMEQEGGVTTRDIAKHYRLTTREANRVVSGIRHMKRYVTEWVPGNGHSPNANTCIPGTLKVLAVNRAKWHKHTWGPIVGVRIFHSDGADNTLHFDTVYDADLIGGFCNVSIYKCLNKKLDAHAGYIWMTKAEYEEHLNNPHDPYTENFYSN